MVHTADKMDVLWTTGQDFVGLLCPCCPSSTVCVIDVPESCASLSCYMVVKAFLVKSSSGGGNGEMAFYFLLFCLLQGCGGCGLSCAVQFQPGAGSGSPC